MITFSTKTNGTMTYWIELNPLVNRVMDSIDFTNLFFIKKKFNYKIKYMVTKLRINLKIKTYLRQH
jgi:hypothetical protein